MNTQTKKFMLTKQGYSHLQEEYQELVKIKREEVVDRIERAREFGDLAENSEYDAAKEEQSLIEARISDLEKVLHKVKLIDQDQKSDFVVIGSTVIVEVDGEVDEFTVVGTMEADPAKRKISNESPVGQALLGAKVGEEIEISTPIIKAKYKIIRVK